MEARDGGSGHTSDQASQKTLQRPGAVLSILPEPPVLASYSPLPPRLASRGRPRRHNPHGAAPPAKSGHCAHRNRPQDPRAQELCRSSRRLPNAQPSGNCSSHPRGTEVRGPFQSRRAPRTDGLAFLGTGLTGKESPSFPMTRSVRAIWTTFPDVLRDGQDPEVRAERPLWKLSRVFAAGAPGREDEVPLPPAPEPSPFLARSSPSHHLLTPPSTPSLP